MRGGIATVEPHSAALATGSEFTLLNPHPLAETLPGVYRDSWMDELRRTAREPFGTRFISALDTVLAPVLATIDNFEAYLDPDTTPEDFLGWMGEWVAATVDAGWPEDRRRAFVGKASELYRRRGTAAGLRDHIQIHTGGDVEVVENGASSWSPKPDGKLPGSPEPVVVIRVTVDDPEALDRSKLDALIRTSKPAHVVHRLEILGTAQRASRKAKAAAPVPDAEDAAADIDTSLKRGSGTAEVTPTAVEPAAVVDAPVETEAAAEPEAPAEPAAAADAPSAAEAEAPLESPPAAKARGGSGAKGTSDAKSAKDPDADDAAAADDPAS